MYNIQQGKSLNSIESEIFKDFISFSFFFNSKIDILSRVSFSSLLKMRAPWYANDLFLVSVRIFGKTTQYIYCL